MRNEWNRNWIVGGLLAIVIGSMGTSAWAREKPGPREMKKTPAPPTFKAVWYNPSQPEPKRIYPLAVILASKDFPVGPEDFWIQTLWRRNYCAVVLTVPNDDWSSVRVDHLQSRIASFPKKVVADPDRVLLIGQGATGSLALRWLEGDPQSICGAVLISSTPMEIIPAGGFALWSPRKEAWSVPIWAVAGDSSDDSIVTLGMWRKLAQTAPDEASLTIDVRLGKKGGHLQPDEEITSWLTSITEGKKPAVGPDRQAEAIQKKNAPFASSMRKLLEKPVAAVGAAGGPLTKTEGPMRISLSIPQGWVRHDAGEIAYKPSETVTNPEGKKHTVPASPYVQVRLIPRILGAKRYALISVAGPAVGGPRAADVLDRCEDRLVRKGYYPFVVDRWTQGSREVRLAAVLFARSGKWIQWLAVYGASDAKGDPAVSPLVMLMTPSQTPQMESLAHVFGQLQQSVKVSWIGPKPKPKPSGAKSGAVPKGRPEPIREP